MKSVPPHFYPTTVTFVDDDPHFLKGIVPALILEDMPHKTFYDARRALEFINTNTHRETIASQIMSVDEDADGDNLMFEPRDLMGMLKAPERFEQISVLVIDYEMPDIRGLDLCAQLNNPFIKKILLTGAADESIAVDAFNEGLINRYVRKHDPNFLDILSKAIAQLQKEYFQELFGAALQTLHKRLGTTALDDPAFIKAFDNLVEKNNIQEYYLIEGTGSFLMVGENQKLYSLITLNDELVSVYLDSSAVENLDAKTLRAIETKDVIPCYYHPFEIPYMQPKNIMPFLHKPTPLKGEKQDLYLMFGEGFIQVRPQDIITWKGPQNPGA